MAEAAVIRAAQRLLTERGAYWLNIHGGGFGRNGVADIWAVYHGHTILIEAKSPTGRLRPLQRYEMRRAAAAGATCVIARSADDVRGVLDTIDRQQEARTA